MPGITELLSMPEGKTLEFKRDLTSLQPILKTLVAFANTAGGTLIIGRDDKGQILGIENVLQEEERLASSIADSIHPFLMSEIMIASVEGRSLLVVSVAHWKGPFYLKSKGLIDGVFVRLGSTNRLAGPELLEELKRCGSYQSFDQTPCLDVDINGLNQEEIKKVFLEVGRKIDEAELVSLGVLVPGPLSKKYVCSQGAILLFGKPDIRNRYFPGAEIRCARFSGIEKVDFIDQYDIKSSLLDAMEEILKFIRRNTRLSAKITGILREETPEYSLVIVREVVTNALVHADYSLKGMHLRISIFDDRLEIESPGMLPLGYTLEDFKSGISQVRNKVIARTFRELHRMEEWGTGYRRILEVCKNGNYPIPFWEEVGMCLRVTLYPHRPFLEQDQESLSLRQQKIMTLLQEKGSLTAKEIHAQVQEVSERGLRADLLELKKRGLIVTQGKGRSSFWAILPKLHTPKH